MLVPWMAYSPPASVMAATPMGFRGVPPGITFGRNGLSRLTSAGGDQAGFRYLPSMCEVPAHLQTKHLSIFAYREIWLLR